MSRMLDSILREGKTAEDLTSGPKGFFAHAMTYVDALDAIPLQDGMLKTNRKELPEGCYHSVVTFVHDLLFSSDMPYRANQTRVFGDDIQVGRFSPEHPFPARTLKRKLENIKTELFTLLDKKSKEPGDRIVIGMGEIPEGSDLNLKTPVGGTLYGLLKDLMDYHECGEPIETGSRNNGTEQTLSISRKALEKLIEGEKDGISIQSWRE